MRKGVFNLESTSVSGGNSRMGTFSVVFLSGSFQNKVFIYKKDLNPSRLETFYVATGKGVFSVLSFLHNRGPHTEKDLGVNYLRTSTNELEITNKFESKQITKKDEKTVERVLLRHPETKEEIIAGAAYDSFEVGDTVLTSINETNEFTHIKEKNRSFVPSVQWERREFLQSLSLELFEVVERNVDTSLKDRNFIRAFYKKEGEKGVSYFMDELLDLRKEFDRKMSEGIGNLPKRFIHRELSQDLLFLDRVLNPEEEKEDLMTLINLRKLESIFKKR